MAGAMTLWSSQPALRPALWLTRPEPAAAAAAAVAAPRPTTHEIFAAHAPFVLRLARRLGVRPNDIEDVGQEIFVVVHRRLPDLQPDVPIRSWLFGIARRVVANYRRQAHRREEHASAGLDLFPGAGDTVRQVQGARDRVKLEEALTRLDPIKREVFVLFEFEGIAMREIADMLECPLNTAYSRLHAARAIVRQHVLGPDCGESVR
jgi:RNA polymerase sigma-70 factor, ECF subfamily